jgi:hypothetical protein
MLRVCNSCKQPKNNTTGTNINNASGLTYKWFCLDCMIKKGHKEPTVPKILADKKASEK